VPVELTHQEIRRLAPPELLRLEGIKPAE
jgi:hypothetical protein